MSTVPGRFRAVRVQLIESPTGVLLKRGRITLRISGPRAFIVVAEILDATSGDGLSKDGILARFSAIDRSSVSELVDQLKERRFLQQHGDDDPTSQGEETPEGIFYWQFGQPIREVRNRLDEVSLVILGVNTVSRHLSQALGASGFNRIEVVDYPLLCNIRLFSDSGTLVQSEWPDDCPVPIPYKTWIEQVDPKEIGCLVATSDFGGLQFMREWNRYAVSQGIPFLPIVLQDLVGYVGPLVVPNESSCFECFRGRQNSHMEDPTLRREAEAQALIGQGVTAFHPTMPAVLGNIAAIELSKFFGRWVSCSLLGSVLQINMIAATMAAKRVLKLPRCPVCSATAKIPNIALAQDAFVPVSSLDQ